MAITSRCDGVVGGARGRRVLRTLETKMNTEAEKTVSLERSLRRPLGWRPGNGLDAERGVERR